MPYPFFSKPSHGGYGSGTVSVAAYDRQSDSLVTANGDLIKVDSYTRDLEASSVYGHVFQQPLQMHPDAVAICQDRIASLRLNMLTDERGPRVFRAFWAVQCGANVVVFFGADIAATIVCRERQGQDDRARRAWAVATAGRFAASYRDLTGYQLPQWQEAVSVATKAARAVPRLLSTHWDVVLTPAGPTLLEVNVKNVFRAPQIAFRKGSFDSELREFLATNRIG